MTLYAFGHAFIVRMFIKCHLGMRAECACSGIGIAINKYSLLLCTYRMKCKIARYICEKNAVSLHLSNWLIFRTANQVETQRQNYNNRIFNFKHGKKTRNDHKTEIFSTRWLHTSNLEYINIASLLYIASNAEYIVLITRFNQIVLEIHNIVCKFEAWSKLFYIAQV